MNPRNKDRGLLGLMAAGGRMIGAESEQMLLPARRAVKRCLDWNGGKLILPEGLIPYMPNGEKVIQHDRGVFARALRPDLLASTGVNSPETMFSEVWSVVRFGIPKVDFAFPMAVSGTGSLPDSRPSVGLDCRNCACPNSRRTHSPNA
jgi:hypothetical protein